MMSDLITVDSLNTSDIGEIQKIQKENNLSEWSAADYLEQINYGNSLNLTARIDSLPIGFIISRLIKIPSLTSIHANSKELKETKETKESEKYETELEIYNIAVHKPFQNRGIGTILLNKLFETCRIKDVAGIWLEVRQGNTTAQKFYRKHGFAEIYKRKDYYRNPSEDAVVMKLEL